MPTWELKAVTYIAAVDGEVPACNPPPSSYDAPLGNAWQQPNAATAEATDTDPPPWVAVRKPAGTSTRSRSRHAQSMLTTRTGKDAREIAAPKPLPDVKVLFFKLPSRPRKLINKAGHADLLRSLSRGRVHDLKLGRRECEPEHLCAEALDRCRI
jgi:hypothetical protein